MILISSIYILIGIILLGVVIKKPKYFWHILVMATILGTGPMVVGYGIVDEYWLACALMGVLLVVSIKKIRNVKNVFYNFHFIVFTILMFYMVFQSFVGLLVLNDVKIVRFIILFSMLWLLSFVISSFEKIFPAPPPKQFINTLFTIITLYLIIYISVGLLTEILVGRNRFELQGFIWTGTTVAVFPVFLALPILFLYINEKSLKAWKVTFILLAITFTAVYYDSRIIYLVLILLGLFSFPLKKITSKKIFRWQIVIIVATLSIFLAVGRKNNATAKQFLIGIGQTVTGIMGNPRLSDAPRRLDVLASLDVIVCEPMHGIFGSGMGTHKYIIVDYYNKLLSQQMGQYKSEKLRRIATFPAFIIDTGIIGISLLCICFLATAQEIIFYTKGRKEIRKYLLLPLCLSFFSMFISINYDLVLFYFMFMPSGILIQLSRLKLNDR